MNVTIKLLMVSIAGQLFFQPLVAAQETTLDRSCGDLTENTFRKPIDYYAADKELIRRVEDPHFPPHVENLQRGNTDDSLGADIAYTLRTFPNHPRALLAMSNLGRKEKTDKPRKSPFTIHCWFQRAIFFRPEDGMVRMVYGIDLMKKSKYQEALVQLAKAEQRLGKNGNLLYNLGLAHFELGDYDKALEYAHQASAAGFNLPGLKKKLELKKSWRDPLPAKSTTNEVDNEPIRQEGIDR